MKDQEKPVVTEQEVITVEQPEPPQLRQALDEIEESLQTFDRILRLSVKRTYPSDWVDQDGKPYLQAVGAERIANPFGVQLRDVTKEKITGKDKKGEYYIWIYRGLASSPKLRRAIEVQGKCWSRDKFFAVKDKELRPIEDISEPNIMQKAYNNLYVNAVTRLLGLRGLNYEFLRECGLDTSKIIKVPYTERGKGKSDKGNDGKKKDGDVTGKKTKTSWTPEESEKALQIRNWLEEVYDKDQKKISNYIEQLTGFVNKEGEKIAGKRDINKLSGPQINLVHRLVRKQYEQWEGKQGE